MLTISWSIPGLRLSGELADVAQGVLSATACFMILGQPLEHGNDAVEIEDAMNSGEMA